MLLKIKDLWKSFDTGSEQIGVLKGVNLTLPSATTLALTGESGSGKTTLLHLVAALDDPDRGQILLDGKKITDSDDADRARFRREIVGIVFQQFNLIPSLDAGANIAFQARLAGQYDPERVEWLADRLDLTAHLEKYPEQLSGGQQQRVAIGRALAGQPRLVLADEPTGNLDEETSTRVLDLMLELVAETDSALLMVTHSRHLASRLARRIHLSQGRLSETGNAQAAE
ncbi:MAG: ABC transporter ATP-binding protein [Pseudomonadota bacterium]